MTDKRKFYKLTDGTIVNIDAVQCIIPSYERWAIVFAGDKRITISEKEYNEIHNNLNIAETLIRIY